MLALTRRVGEEVVLGDPNNPLGSICVVDIHGDKVKLSFKFPREMQINRRELADQKAREGDRSQQKLRDEPHPAPPSSEMAPSTKPAAPQSAGRAAGATTATAGAGGAGSAGGVTGKPTRHLGKARTTRRATASASNAPSTT